MLKSVIAAEMRQISPNLSSSFKKKKKTTASLFIYNSKIKEKQQYFYARLHNYEWLSKV